MNAIVYWKCSKEYLVRFTDRLDIKFCAYYYDSKAEDIASLTGNYQGIYLYTDIAELAKKTIIHPIDGALIKKFRPFEAQAMGIINRWRRSISADESYLSLRDSYFIYLQYWYDFILSNHIEFFVLSLEPHIPMTYFPYAICKAYGIPVAIMGQLPVIDGQKLNFCLEESLDCLDHSLENRYSQLCEKYEKNNKEIPLANYLEAYFSMYAKSNEKVERVIVYNEKEEISDRIKLYLQRAKIYLNQKRIKVLVKKIKYYFMADIKSRPMLKYIESLEENPQDAKFFVFFLHLQPECTTLPKGGDFENQLLAIRMVSSCLPEGYYLYVKEHPAYWDIRHRRESIFESRNKHFYNEIEKMPNVRLIDHKFNSLALMDSATGIITITGTAGFEAMFKQKPVIVFAKALYADYKYVYHVKNMDECHNAIKDILQGQGVGRLRDVRIFLKALEPLVISYGCDEKSYVDNGIPVPDESDFQTFIDRVADFYRVNYENSK